MRLPDALFIDSGAEYYAPPKPSVDSVVSSIGQCARRVYFPSAVESVCEEGEVEKVETSFLEPFIDCVDLMMNGEDFLDDDFEEILQSIEYIAEANRSLRFLRPSQERELIQIFRFVGVHREHVRCRSHMNRLFPLTN